MVSTPGLAVAAWVMPTPVLAVAVPAGVLPTPVLAIAAGLVPAPGLVAAVPARVLVAPVLTIAAEPVPAPGLDVASGLVRRLDSSSLTCLNTLRLLDAGNVRYSPSCKQWE